ncbi:MAG TPA: hypothetical protein VMM12_06730 [Longimicrobiales bacterium]|nr:hypothetical protein [Longimicrobiales bacterium]
MLHSFRNSSGSAIQAPATVQGALARGPPQHDIDFDADPGFDIDQTPTYDLTEPEPEPDNFDFDQSAGA